MDSRKTIAQKGSYNTIYSAISNFTNYYAEEGERVSKLPALGYGKEKMTLAMPPVMHQALTAHVTARIGSLRPTPGNSYEAKAPEKIAKYLGK